MFSLNLVRTSTQGLLNKFFVGLHGDKTYNTFCLWKHHVNLLLLVKLSHISSTDEDHGLRIESFAVINLRGVSTNKRYYKGYYINFLTNCLRSKRRRRSTISTFQVVVALSHGSSLNK